MLFFVGGVIYGYVLSSTAFSPSSTKPSFLQPFTSQLIVKQMSIRAVGIGDSLTKGVGDPSQKGYAGIVTHALINSGDVSSGTLVDEGIMGDTTDDLLKVLQKSSVQQEIKNANIIYLTIGGNDLVNVIKAHFLNLDLNEFDVTRKKYEVNLNKILKEVRQLNPYATIYYMGLYNPFEDYFTSLNPTFDAIINQWNQAGKTILELYPHTVFIPTFDLFHGHTGKLLYKDHFHPNPTGYHLIAQRILSHFINISLPQS